MNACSCIGFFLADTNDTAACSLQQSCMQLQPSHISSACRTCAMCYVWQWRGPCCGAAVLLCTAYAHASLPRIVCTQLSIYQPESVFSTGGCTSHVRLVLMILSRPWSATCRCVSLLLWGVCYVSGSNNSSSPTVCCGVDQQYTSYSAPQSMQYVEPAPQT